MRHIMALKREAPQWLSSCACSECLGFEKKEVDPFMAKK